MKVISLRYIFLLDFWLVGGMVKVQKINGSRNLASGAAVNNWQKLPGILLYHFIVLIKLGMLKLLWAVSRKSQCRFFSVKYI